MPDLKPSEALAQHRNLIYRAALEKLKISQTLNDQEFAEVQRREAIEQERKEKAELKAKKDRPGRKTKLTRELIKKLADIASEGHDMRDVVLSVGITNATYYRWMSQDDSDPLIQELKESMEEALGKAAIWNLQQVRRAAGNGSWQASMEWLARMRPETWGRKDRLQIKAEGMQSTVNNNTTVIYANMPDNGFTSPEFPELNGHENGNGHALLNGRNGNGADSH